MRKEQTDAKNSGIYDLNAQDTINTGDGYSQLGDLYEDQY